MKRLGLILFILSLPLSLSGQQSWESDKQINTFILQLGISPGQFIDNATSSASRRDISIISQSLLYTTEKGNMYNYFHQDFILGGHAIKNSSRLNPYNFDIKINLGYTWTYNLLKKENQGFNMWSGGSINTHQSFIVNNSAFPTYSNFTYIGGDFIFKYKLDKYEFDSFIKIPLLSIVTRPSYSIIGPTIINKGDVSTYLSAARTYLRGFGGLSCNFGFTWKNKKNKMHRISYKWDYYSSGKKDIWLYKEGSHTISYSIYLRETHK